MNFKVGVVLPAGGTGERMGIDTPKQYCCLLNRPLISHTVQCFERLNMVESIVVAVPQHRISYTEEILNKYSHKKVSVTSGASTRHRSICNGLKHLKKECADVEVVIIHDAVRPFVEEDIIQKVAHAAHKHGAAGAIRPLVSTVIATDMDGFLDQSLERTKYQNSEMPQAFRYDIIKPAYDKCTDYDLDYGTECLHLAHKYMGTKARLVEGPSSLWKITHKRDLFAAEGIIREKDNFVLSLDCPDKFSSILSDALRKKCLNITMESGKANNFILYNKSHDIKTLESQLITHISDIKSLHGGVVIFVIEASLSASSLMELHKSVKSVAHSVKEDKVCVHGINIQEGCASTEAATAMASLIFERNLTYSGQIMLF